MNISPDHICDSVTYKCLRNALGDDCRSLFSDTNSIFVPKRVGFLVEAEKGGLVTFFLSYVSPTRV